MGLTITPRAGGDSSRGRCGEPAADPEEARDPEGLTVLGLGDTRVRREEEEEEEQEEEGGRADSVGVGGLRQA